MRTNARLRTLFFTELFPLASKVLMKFSWVPDDPIDGQFQWYWSQVVVVGTSLVFESGVNANGHSCRWIADYLENLTLWNGWPGLRWISTMRLAGFPDVQRIVQNPGWPNTDPKWPGGILNPLSEWDHLQAPPYGSFSYPQPFPNRQVAMIPMAEDWPLDQLTTAP
jgi:hypothetical protein